MNLQKLSLMFAAGCFGGLVKGLVAVASAQIGINTALGVTMLPSLSAFLVYQHMVWGGLWAFLFLIPLKGSYYYRGAVFSLGQTMVQVFVILPKMGKGMLGLHTLLCLVLAAVASDVRVRPFFNEHLYHHVLELIP